MPPKPKGAKAPVKKPTTQNPASKPSKSTTRTKDAEKNKPEPSMAAEIETDTELTELTSDTDANAAPPVTIAQRPVTRAKNANQRPGKILEQFSVKRRTAEEMTAFRKSEEARKRKMR